MRVLAAMSGGVDSAVAAARAVAAGHDVTGVHLALSKNPQSYRTGARGCCSREDSHDARRAADVIGIPFYIWDMAEEFHADVVEDFLAEYAAGRTPNPCLRCNEKIKFAAVLDRALALGFDAVATGHYARLVEGRLFRAADAEKDQSYVLGVLRPDQLRHAMFPLGDSLKPQVREEAKSRGLAVATKPDSHDICFIADGDTKAFLRGHLGEAPGDIVDGATGEVLGRHEGAYAYTVGQRKGLNLGRPAADGRPRYVLSITPVSNTVTVGPAEALEVSTITANRAIRISTASLAASLNASGGASDETYAGNRPSLETGPIECKVQLRAHGAVHDAVVEIVGDELLASLRDKARGVAAGQAIVVYRDDEVLASATITSAR